MKDYSRSSEERESFIKKYDIKNGQIIITYINNKKEILGYTRKNERKILDKMYKQATESSKRIESLNREISQAILAFIISLVIFISVSLSLLSSTFTIPLLGYIIAGSQLVMLGLSTKQVIKKKLIKEDIIKTQYFLENENVFNKNLIKQNTCNKESCNINTIDKLSIKDLKELKNQLESRGYSTVKPKVRTLRPYNKKKYGKN